MLPDQLLGLVVDALLSTDGKEQVETGEQVNDEKRIKAGKLNLVDLAGSERTSKTGA